MAARSLRANRQLRYASLAIRTKAGGHEILLPMSPDTFVTYLPGRSDPRGYVCTLAFRANRLRTFSSHFHEFTLLIDCDNGENYEQRANDMSDLKSRSLRGEQE